MEIEQWRTRNAGVDDATTLAALATQLGYPTTQQQSCDRLSAILDSPEQTVIVATSKDTSIVGWIHVFVTLRVESDCFAEIGGFVVAEGDRKKGIGTRLLAAAEAWTIGQGITKLRVRSRTSREDAHQFYRRLGFSGAKEQQVFDKQLAIKS